MQCCQKCSLRVLRKILRQNFFWRKYFSLSFLDTDWAKCFGFLAKVLLQGCRNYNLRAQRSNFRKIKFKERIQFHNHFRTMSEKFSTFERFPFNNVGGIAFDTFNALTWGTSFFFKKRGIFSNSGNEEKLRLFCRENFSGKVKFALTWHREHIEEDVVFAIDVSMGKILANIFFGKTI